MLKILEVLYNIMSAFYGAGWMFIVSVFTGKMPKISVYHFTKHLYSGSGIDVTSDKYIKTHNPNHVTDQCKSKIIEDFIDHLTSDPDFMVPCHEVKFPIIEGGKKIGETTIYNVITKSKNRYINELK